MVCGFARVISLADDITLFCIRKPRARPEVPKTLWLNEKEKCVIIAYRTKTDLQKAVDILLGVNSEEAFSERNPNLTFNKSYNDTTDEELDIHSNDEKYIDMVVYDEPAAAGLGNYLDSHSDSEMLTIKTTEVPSKADFGIRITGDSMEPEIADGSIVWVQPLPRIENGQIGIFILDGAAYCKKLHIDYDKQKISLLSLNNKYGPIEIDKNNSLRTVGRVLE